MVWFCQTQARARQMPNNNSPFVSRADRGRAYRGRDDKDKADWKGWLG